MYCVRLIFQREAAEIPLLWILFPDHKLKSKAPDWSNVTESTN